MTCNIDARGKRVRLVIGVATFAVGCVLLLAWAIPAASAVAWVVSAATIAGGAFAIFEARKGWCALRAMGFKTPI